MITNESNTLRLWYDPEGDYLEVSFGETAGYFRQTNADEVMVKVDQSGRVIGFSILGYSKLKGDPLNVDLVAAG